MSDWLSRIRSGAEALAGKAVEAGKVVASQVEGAVSSVTGSGPKSTIYVEYATTAEAANAAAAVTALNGAEPIEIEALHALVIKVKDPEKSDAIMTAVTSLKPTTILAA